MQRLDGAVKGAKQMKSGNGKSELDRVRAQTNPKIVKAIDARMEERIRFYATQPPEVISRRIEELDLEWDIERLLATNASAVALSGLVLGVVVSRKWLILTAGVLGFLLQHTVQGWCPPVPALRRLGIRTRGEIDREKYALKLIRGDFQSIAANPEQIRRNPASEVLGAVSA
jgi:hypothetical protein